MTKKFPRVYPQSKFVFDFKSMTLVAGKAPLKDCQLFKGETTEGEKMELAMGPNSCGLCAYWGWSS